jgi:hypothetical protein
VTDDARTTGVGEAEAPASATTHGESGAVLSSGPLVAQPSGPTTKPAGPPARPGLQRASTRQFVLDLFMITAGVLIALSVDGLREWVQNRRVVATAQATIEREIRDNRDEVLAVLGSAQERRQNLDQALQLANELIEGQPSAINSINLGFNLAETSAARWEIAQRSGALAHMDYDQARAYARVYEAQARFAQLQDRTMARLESAAAVASGDPRGLTPEDLQQLRQQVLGMIGELQIERQLASRLLELYDGVLGGETTAGGGS